MPRRIWSFVLRLEPKANDEAIGHVNQKWKDESMRNGESQRTFSKFSIDFSRLVGYSLCLSRHQWTSGNTPLLAIRLWIFSPVAMHYPSPVGHHQRPIAQCVLLWLSFEWQCAVFASILKNVAARLIKVKNQVLVSEFDDVLMISARRLSDEATDHFYLKERVWHDQSR